MTQPTPAEQLLNLADRAERHQLTGDEAARLREGVAHHCARADQAEVERDALRQDLARQGQELATWRATVAALDSGAPGTARHRAERAEATIERVTSLVRHYEQWGATGWQPYTAQPSQVAREFRAALDEHQEQPHRHLPGERTSRTCPQCTNPA